MNRQEFMNRLEELLIGISPEEREEALAYYRNYFEDAGVENEEKVIRELESPEKLAASIRAGLQENGVETNSTGQQRVGVVTSGTNQQTYGAEQSGSSRQTDNSDNTTLIIVLVAVVAVCTCPIWLGFLSGLLGLILGILGALFGMTVGFLVGGFACIGVGISYLCLANVPLGILAIGLGALLVALGILMLILLVLFCGRFLPWAVRGIISLFQRIFHKNRKEARA